MVKGQRRLVVLTAPPLRVAIRRVVAVVLALAGPAPVVLALADPAPAGLPVAEV